MIRLAANLSFLFTELPFADRFVAAAKAGFRLVEWNFAFEFPKSELLQLMNDNGLGVSLINTPAGDMAGGELGLAALPGRESDAEAAFDQALDYATALGAPVIHYLAGKPPLGADPAAIDAIFLNNMCKAADLAAQAGITIALEPLNPRDRAGYHLMTVEHAMRLIAEANRDNIKLQLDIYHRQINGGDIIHTIEQTIDSIAHVQIAGVPGRHEPSHGELAYDAILSRMDVLGYTGSVGCEYIPAGSTLDGLSWASSYLKMGRV